MADPGIGVGAGGFFASMMNPELATRVAQHLTPNPNPLAQQGQGAQPGAVDGQGNPVGGAPPPGANLAPSASTQPDPVNASYIADLMKYQRVSAAADDFNRNIQGVAAGFGTAQQQASKRQALGSGGGVGGGLADLAGMQKMQDQTIADNEHARFQANAAVFAKTLGLPIDQTTEIMNNPEAMKTALANATSTSTMKDADAATRAYADANPKATPADIANYKANLIAGGMGGSDLEQRQYLQEKQSGLTTDDYATWKAKHAAAAGAMQAQAKDAQDFKDTATQDYTSVHSKQADIQQYVDTLNKDPDATRRAMSTVLPTTGVAGTWDPLIPQNVKDAAIALNKLKSALAAEGLSGVKNVRNIREFNTLAQAATAGLDPNASDGDFKSALNNLRNRYLDAQATTELSVGHKLTGELVGHGNRDLLDPKSPYFNGGSEEVKPLSKDDLEQAKTLIARDGRDAVIAHLKSQGYDTSGL